MPEFLDLVHHYIMIITKPEEHERISELLLGPSRVNRGTIIDERAGFAPPAWWRGDAYASRSGVTAMMTLRR